MAAYVAHYGSSNPHVAQSDMEAFFQEFICQDRLKTHWWVSKCILKQERAWKDRQGTNLCVGGMVCFQRQGQTRRGA